MPPKPFKHPRPSHTAKKAPKPKFTTARKSDKSASKPAKPKSRDSASTSFSRPSIASSLALDASESDDPFASDPDTEPEMIDVEMQVEEEEPKESIPEALLTRLIHEFFREDGTRISKEANAAADRYMDTFVREAVARAAYMRVSVEGGGEGGDGFLEVEDLEKLAPQLLLDF